MSKKKHMSDKKRIVLKSVSLALAATLLLSGCGVTTVTSTGTTVVDEGLTFGLEPVFDYMVPKEIPKVHVDTAGYLTESTKVAVFSGDSTEQNALKTYRIRDKETREIVYEGTLQQNEQKEKSTLYGTFTDFQTAGDYYIECDDLGCSYYFSIGEDVYLSTCLSIKERIQASKMGQENNENSYFTNGWRMDERGNRDTRKACETLSYLLLGYEIYPAMFEQVWSADADPEQEKEGLGKERFFAELRYETDWLLSMQDSVSGGIYSGIRSKSEGVDVGTSATEEEYILREISEDATAGFAAVMAKYGYLYQQIDKDYATTCLKAASKAWKYLESSPNTKPEQMFYAATELYRASNSIQYHSYILQNQMEILNGSDSFSLLMGEITYLSTRRKVDKELCGKMMSEMMKTAEDISTVSRQEDYLVKVAEQEEILNSITVMSVVDYVITNHEYYTVIENHIHYLLGRNPEGINMVQTMDLLDGARMLMYISSITAEKELILSE